MDYIQKSKKRTYIYFEPIQENNKDIWNTSDFKYNHIKLAKSMSVIVVQRFEPTPGPTSIIVLALNLLYIIFKL